MRREPGSGRRQKAGERITIIREGEGKGRDRERLPLSSSLCSLTVCTGFTPASHPPPHPPPFLLSSSNPGHHHNSHHGNYRSGGIASAAQESDRHLLPASHRTLLSLVSRLPTHLALVRHSALSFSLCTLAQKASGQTVGSGEHFFSCPLTAFTHSQSLAQKKRATSCS